MSRFVQVLAIAGSALVLSTAAFAAAPPQCGSRVEMVKALSDKFRETPVAVGVVNSDAVLEVFASETGTWTILATGTDGKSCVLSAGEGWETALLANLPGA